MTRGEQYNAAVSLYRNGEVARAEAIYRGLISECDEVFPYALHNLVHLFLTDQRYLELEKLCVWAIELPCCLNAMRKETYEYVAAAVLGRFVQLSNQQQNDLVTHGDPFNGCGFNVLYLGLKINHPGVVRLSPKYLHAVPDDELAQLGIFAIGSEVLGVVVDAISERDAGSVASLIKALVFCVTRGCLWERVPSLLVALGQSKSSDIAPHMLISLFDDSHFIASFACRYLTKKTAPASDGVQSDGLKKEVSCFPKLKESRLLFICNDLFDHATTRLLGDFIEASVHSTKVEVWWMSDYSVSDFYKRVIGCRLIQVDRNPMAFAHAIHSLQPNLVIDLKGITKNSFIEYFPLIRGVRIIHWLGYPGLIPGRYVHASIFDEFVFPETPIQTDGLPYIPTNPKLWRERSCRESGSVKRLCCFNEHYKITEPIFDTWMHVLSDCPDLRLSLLEGSVSSRQSITNWVRSFDSSLLRQIDFVPKASHSIFLDRLIHYDLFLDTYPCSAHTVMMDCVAVNLPLVTIIGSSIQSRVAGSVNRCLGNEELNSTSLLEYKETVLRVLSSPEQLEVYSSNIRDNRSRLMGGSDSCFEQLLEVLFKNALLG